MRCMDLLVLIIDSHATILTAKPSSNVQKQAEAAQYILLVLLIRLVPIPTGSNKY